MNMFTACCPCFRSCLDCVQGPSFTGSASYSKFTTPFIPSIRLDVSSMGKDVVILKEGERICGTGGALGTVPLVQNKSYFQVNVQQTGAWGIGLGNKNSPLDKAPVEEQFWGLRETGELVANGSVVGKLSKPIEEGDCVGLTYDHIELRLYINGELCDTSITGVKGPVYPLIYVDDSAILDVKFKSFSYPIPSGFEEIMVEQTLL